MVKLKSFAPPFLKKLGENLRRRGDFLFLLVLLISFGVAALIFYQTVYLPIYLPKPLPPREPLFKTELFNKVVGVLESRGETLAEELADIPRNPLQ